MRIVFCWRSRSRRRGATATRRTTGRSYGLAARAHACSSSSVDAPWYAAARDMPAPPYGDTRLTIRSPRWQTIAGSKSSASKLREGTGAHAWRLSASGSGVKSCSSAGGAPSTVLVDAGVPGSANSSSGCSRALRGNLATDAHFDHKGALEASPAPGTAGLGASALAALSRRQRRSSGGALM